MKWILLWSLVGHQYGGPATAEFNTKEACEYAAVQAERVESMMGMTRAVCVPKGEEK